MTNSPLSPFPILSMTIDRATTGGAVPDFLLKKPEISEKDLEGKSEEEQEMLKLMGFAGFDSTKVREKKRMAGKALQVIACTKAPCAAHEFSWLNLSLSIDYILQGKKVPGNDVSAVHIVPKRKYRQYMNRKGGFNRPLDFVG